jgi:hypothetical protein
MPPPATLREDSSWALLRTGSIKRMAAREEERRIMVSFEPSYRIQYGPGHSENAS